MPFVTEALWQQLPRQGEALMVAPWPKVEEEVLAVDAKAIARCVLAFGFWLNPLR